MSLKRDVECLNGLVHGLHSTQRNILANQQLILDKLNGIKHYKPGDCEICCEAPASYLVTHKEHKDRSFEACASCAIAVTTEDRRGRCVWQLEPIRP